MPIIAVTSLDDNPEQRLAHGIQGYLAKPVSMHRLQETLELYQLEAKA
jgi:response regulator of citrate/malate metabolism